MCVCCVWLDVNLPLFIWIVLLPIFHVIVRLYLFNAAEFSDHLLDNLDRPKGIETIKDDSKH